MKTYANNPPVKYSELNEDQKNSACDKMADDESIEVEVFNAIVDGFENESIEFFITSPTSVAVRKK